MTLCIVKNEKIGLSETFIRAHADRLPTNTILIHGMPPHIDGQKPYPLTLASRVSQKIRRSFNHRSYENEYLYSVYSRLFRSANVEFVLAEYGLTGIAVRQVCQDLNIPMCVHFHGFDASVYTIIERHRSDYTALFQDAKAIIAVSRSMQQALISMGAEAAKVHYNPCGVDIDKFTEGSPENADQTFLSVGRMVEKKGPHLLLLAFADVKNHYPDAKLRIIGEGPLLGVCLDLAQGLGISDAVTFLGAQPHEVVMTEMKNARAFVQHSVIANNGDSEGTPVAVLEAGASGLPVIATRHAGIPDVVIDGETGFLSCEKDTAAMAANMLRVLEDPKLASTFGRAARCRIEEYFSMEKSINNLWTILNKTMIQMKRAE